MLIKVQCRLCGHLQGMRSFPKYKCYKCDSWTHDVKNQSFDDFKPGMWATRICVCGHEQKMTGPPGYKCSRCHKQTYDAKYKKQDTNEIKEVHSRTETESFQGTAKVILPSPDIDTENKSCKAKIIMFDQDEDQYAQMT